MILRKLTLSAIIATGLSLTFQNTSPYIDFALGYWHPSRLLLQGRNPYEFCDLACLSYSIDAESLGRMNPAGMYVMYNPAVFPLLFPWAVLPFHAATLLYLFLFFFSVSLVFQLLAELFTKDQRLSVDGSLIFWISALPIGLLLQNLLWGSPSWIGLVGVVLFLVHYDRRPFVAGLFLSLTLVKIHLFLIFGAALLARCVRIRNWRTPFGVSVAASLSLVSALFFRPDILTTYSEVVRKGQAFNYVNATLPSVGRYVFDVNGPSYLFGPCVLLSVVMFLLFWFTDSSRLTQKLCCVLPLSIGFAPYAWGHDYICAAPVLVMAAAYITDNARDVSGRRVMFVYLLGLNVCALSLALVGTTSPFLNVTYGVGLMTAGVVAFRLAFIREPMYL